jgi:hypothetical protein
MLAPAEHEFGLDHDPDEVVSRYLSIASRLGSEQYKILRYGGAKLAWNIRGVADRSVDSGSVAAAADGWLYRRMGSPNDLLRRATVAMLASGLSLDSMAIPQSIRDRYVELHLELSRSLAGARVYDVARYGQDLLLATGMILPVGVFWVKTPNSHSILTKMSLSRRSASGVVQQLLRYGVDPLREALAGVGVAPWAEIQFDRRDVRGFDAVSVLESYRQLAELMKVRPDLAGVHGVSWFYDPQLSRVSPTLAIVRQIAERGGGRFVRLQVDKAQTALAVARSPSRQRSFDAGDFKPAPYGLYWARRDLIAWADELAPFGRQTERRKHRIVSNASASLSEPGPDSTLGLEAGS